MSESDSSPLDVQLHFCYYWYCQRYCWWKVWSRIGKHCIGLKNCLLLPPLLLSRKLWSKEAGRPPGGTLAHCQLCNNHWMPWTCALAIGISNRAIRDPYGPIMHYNQMQCNSMQYNQIRFNMMQWKAIPYNSILYNQIQYHTMPCNTLKYHAIPCNTAWWRGRQRGRKSKWGQARWCLITCEINQ